MRKQRSVNWRNTNLGMLGSDLEKKIKAAAAKGEPQWRDAGRSPGVQVWRIEQFKVASWPEHKHGKFHEGDSYIVLHTYKKDPTEDSLAWAIYFWIGSTSSADEYGTAAYKAQELDHILDDAAVQHRVAQGNEPSEFLSLFPDDSIEILPGGVATGFRHVEREPEAAVLLKVKGQRGHVVVKYVRVSVSSLNSGDVFVLGDGKRVWKWVGREANVSEKSVGEAVGRALQGSYGGGATLEVIDEGVDDTDTEFWQALGGNNVSCLSIFDRVRPPQGKDDVYAAKEGFPCLYKLSDRGWLSSGQLKFSKQRSVSRGALDSRDVFVLDNGCEVFIWVGKTASGQGKQRAFFFAQHYMERNNRPAFLPLSTLNEGAESPRFLAVLA